jgi:hypothetical protein
VVFLSPEGVNQSDFFRSLFETASVFWVESFALMMKKFKVGSNFCGADRRLGKKRMVDFICYYFI